MAKERPCGFGGESFGEGEWDGDANDEEEGWEDDVGEHHAVAIEVSHPLWGVGDGVDVVDEDHGEDGEATYRIEGHDALGGGRLFCEIGCGEFGWVGGDGCGHIATSYVTCEVDGVPTVLSSQSEVRLSVRFAMSRLKSRCCDRLAVSD